MKYKKKSNKTDEPKGLSVSVRNNDVNGALRVLRKRLVKDLSLIHI